MTNHEIARRFTRIGDVLEIQGENPFKVRAYRRAAEAITLLAEPLVDIDARGELEQISGFGAAIVAKTRDFLRTGTTPLYEQTRSAVPPGVLQMAALPGIGPKTTKALWEALRVTDVDALEAAVRAGRVQGVAGFGPGKEKNLLEAIERARRLRERVPLFVALPYARRVAEALRARPEVAQIELAGSLRRGRDTVGNLDLVGASSDPEATLQAFTGLPGMVETVAQGPTHVTAMCDLGLPVDLRLTSENNFGALWHHFSSGQAYNLRLRDLAHSRGLKIDEHGVRNETTGEEKSRGPDEAPVYQALGLSFIPPELREDTGEIEAAQQNALPRLVEEADFRGQLHCHSTYSDGRASSGEMAQAALARGDTYLAITDHSRSLSVANGLDRSRLLAQLDEIAALNRALAGRLTILTGQEVDILADGSLDNDDDLLARLDIVVASVHIRHKETREEMTARIVRAVENPHVDILGHPTGRLLGRREPYEVDMEAVIDACARTGTVLEINAAPERMDVNDVYARRAKEAGVRLTVNTDAHSVEGLDQLFWGLQMARRAWLEPADVVNTYDLQALHTVLKGPK